MQDTQDREMTQAEAEFYAEIEEAGHDIQAVGAYRDYIGEDYTPLASWEDWIGQFEESYQGEMDTREFAEQMAEEMFPISTTQENDFLVRYFDYEKWERDLFMGDYFESNGYIFRSI